MVQKPWDNCIGAYSACLGAAKEICICNFWTTVESSYFKTTDHLLWIVIPKSDILQLWTRISNIKGWIHPLLFIILHMQSVFILWVFSQRVTFAENAHSFRLFHLYPRWNELKWFRMSIGQDRLFEMRSLLLLLGKGMARCVHPFSQHQTYVWNPNQNFWTAG
jgi:hypothetical protein